MARRARNSTGVMTRWVAPRRGVFIKYAMFRNPSTRSVISRA
jgi:hypothetical protein